MANPNVTIDLAVYASNNKGEDVTADVTSIIEFGNDDVPVNNTSFGDPDVGSTKYFLVWYTAVNLNGGNPVGLACDENATIDLVPGSGTPSYYYDTSVQPGLATSAISAVTVNRAIYGTVNNGYDVTAACQAIVNQGALANGQAGNYQIPINNETFGGDPDVGNTKYFAMSYSASGSTFYVGGQEGQTVTLQTSAATSSPRELEADAV
jgi:hypothetical protein